MAEAVCRDMINRINTGEPEAFRAKDAKPGNDGIHGTKVPEVISRGLSVFPGDKINPLAEAVLNEIGLSNKDHKARQLSAADFEISCPEGENGIAVITMTESHKAEVLRRFPDIKNVFTLKETAGESGDVPDPFGGNKDIYYFCLLKIAGLISKAIAITG